METEPSFPKVVLAFPASLEEGQEFFDRLWPEARAIADEHGRLYEMFGLSRASLKEMFGPGVWLKALKTMRSGYSPGRPIGNPWLMPGVFLVREGLILRRWESRNIGDNPDFGELFLSLSEIGEPG